MTRSTSTSAQRRELAAKALAGLGSHRSDSQQLSVQCRHAHHLAAVYSTSDGPVYVSRTGPHSHGQRDFIDTGRHGSRGGGEFVDLLVATPLEDDELPAWCDCGDRTLSRRELLGLLETGQRTVHID